MAFMTFNQESAEKAGGQRIETGAHVGILQAEMITAKTGTQGMQFSLHGESDANYITVYYKKSDGTELKGGMAFINAIMGVLKVREINIRELTEPQTGEIHHQVVEFTNKKIGFVLQKVLYSKDNGDDGYKLELVMPFHDQTRQTCAELIKQSPPTTIDKILLTLEDKDERKPQNKSGGYNGASNYDTAVNNQTAERPTSKFDQVNPNAGNNNGMAQSDEEFFT